MSLVNDMLRDLEQRNGRATGPLGAVLPAHTPTVRHSPNIVLAGFFVLAAVTALSGLAQRTYSVAAPAKVVMTSPKSPDGNVPTPRLSPGPGVTAQPRVPDEETVATVAGLHPYRLDYRLANKPATRLPTRWQSATRDSALPGVSASSNAISLSARPVTPMNTLSRTLITRVDPAVQLRTDGLSALQHNRAAQAEQHFRQLVLLAPSDTEAHLLLHQALTAQSRLPQARAALTDALEVTAEPARIASVLAHALLDTGDSAAAQALLEEYGDAAGTDLEYVALLAAVYERNGAYQQAADRYMYLVSQRPGHGPWWVGLAITSEALGAQGQARDAFEHARRSRGLDPALARYASERLKSMDSTP